MRFECQRGCTACCREHGFVYLTEADIVRISAALGMTVGRFERKYVYRNSTRRRLRVTRSQRCVFLRGDGCSIHPVKPTQCSLFPFWPELVDDKRAWKKTAAWCPGIGKGELIQIKTAKSQAEEMRAAYPELYPK